MTLFAELPGERLDAFLARSAENLSRSGAQKLLDEGCVLLKLWYDEEVSLKQADEWAEQYGAKEAIVLLSDFYVTKNPTFSSNTTMKNWSWILVRNNGGWELKTSGY